MIRLRLNPSAALTPTAAGLSVRSDLHSFQLDGADAGAFLERIAPLLDGTRDREALLAAVSGYSPRSLAALLSALEARGLVEAVDDEASLARVHPGAPPAGAGVRRGGRGQAEFFRAWSRDPAEAARRLGQARVLVVGRAQWCRVAAVELRAAGVGVVRRAGQAAVLGAEGAPSWSLMVATAAPENREEEERLAGYAHRAGLVSLWAHLGRTKAVLGPVVTPGQTACRLCATVDALNPPAATEGARGGNGATDPCREARERLLGHHVAMEALKLISGYTPSALGGRLLVQDLATLESSRHTLVRLPWCRVCGDGAVASPGAP